MTLDEVTKHLYDGLDIDVDKLIYFGNFAETARAVEYLVRHGVLDSSSIDVVNTRIRKLKHTDNIAIEMRQNSQIGFCANPDVESSLCDRCYSPCTIIQAIGFGSSNRIKKYK